MAIRYYVIVLVALLATTAVIWPMQAVEEDHDIGMATDHPPSPSAAATSTVQSVGTTVTQFGAIGDGTTNDGPAFTKAWDAVCHGTSKSPLIIPAGKTFLLQPVKFDGPCTSDSTITVELMGELKAPMKSQWQRPHQDGGGWISFSNVPNLVLNCRGGQIYGHGADWWNDEPSARPTALGFHGCSNLQVAGLTSVDPPKNHISIDGCIGATISDIHLKAPENAHNTDGIDISKSSNVKILGGTIGTGDDCIAINSGCKTINITGVLCGPGHGISVGSLGKKGEIADVADVHVKNCTFTKTQNGARIKTWQNGVGQASHITFEDIILNQADNPIYINQHYCDEHSDKGCPTDEKSAVKISHVSFTGFRGSTIDGKAPINMSCSKVEPCQDVTLDNIHMTGPASMKPICDNVHGTANDTDPPVPVGCMMPPLSSILSTTPVPAAPTQDHPDSEAANIRQRPATTNTDDHDADRDEL